MRQRGVRVIALKARLSHRLGQVCLKWGILFTFGVVPAVAVQFLRPPPQERPIHVEAFRYGKEPWVIRCNRGDLLRLSFSSRDTGHSFFLEEFDVDVKITPGHREVAVYRVTDPTAPPDRTPEVVLRAEHPGPLGWLVSKCQYRCHVWCGPMHAFEQGNLILEPNSLLWGGWGLLLGILIVVAVSISWQPELMDLVSWRNLPGGQEQDLLRALPFLRPVVRWGYLQYLLVAISGVALYFVIVAALGGTKVAGRNFGVIFPWVVWLFLLTAVLTPLGGRMWCLICPLPALGELFKRGGNLRPVASMRGSHAQTRGSSETSALFRMPPEKASPAKVLMQTLALLLIGTFSSAIVAVPRVTGFLFLLLVVAASLSTLFGRIRTFCLYLCPVAAFLKTYSGFSKAYIRPKNHELCERCPSHACQYGNQRGWPCPFGVRIANVHDNIECGWCLECLKSCPFSNVSIGWRKFGGGIWIRNWAEAWQAGALFTLAVAYSIIHLGPWPQVRDAINLIDKFSWPRFMAYLVALWTTLTVGVLGGLFTVGLLAHLLSRGSFEVAKAARTAASGLIPLGLSVWMAFAWQMLSVHGSFVLQVLSDPLGWGWNLFGTANWPWRQLFPEAIPFVQVGLILLGFYYSLKVTAAQWLRQTSELRQSWMGLLPIWASFSVFGVALIKFFAD